MNQAIPDPTQTTLAPGNVAQAVLTPEPTSRWQALRQVGWWKGSDYMMLFFLGMHMLAGIFCTIFHVGSINGLIVGLLNCCLILLIWGVMLLYRCMDFVLQIRASQEMLPIDAARIAVGFMQGGQPLQKP
jgi:hypothetical protein